MWSQIDSVLGPPLRLRFLRVDRCGCCRGRLARFRHWEPYGGLRGAHWAHRCVAFN